MPQYKNTNSITNLVLGFVLYYRVVLIMHLIQARTTTEEGKQSAAKAFGEIKIFWLVTSVRTTNHIYENYRPKCPMCK